MTTNRSPTARASIVQALIVAGLFLAATAALKLLTPEHLSRELANRLLGVLLGVVVVVYANAVPKALTPLARLRCDPATEQALRRFTGWSITLGGAAYAVAWMIAPIESADIVATSLLGTALLPVIARLVWAKTRRSRA
jgi:hypothetical protein